MPNQNGAPIRLVVPWKYGFKSIKSIVRITLVDEEPPTTWNMLQPHEYGFYSNVNPTVDHPRWSQATERRDRRRAVRGRQDTLMFNGYEAEVAALYAGHGPREVLLRPGCAGHRVAAPSIERVNGALRRVPAWPVYVVGAAAPLVVLVWR